MAGFSDVTFEHVVEKIMAHVRARKWDESELDRVWLEVKRNYKKDTTL